MCLSTQGYTQTSEGNKRTLLFSHFPAPHSVLWHLSTPILSCASRTWSPWEHPTGPAAVVQGLSQGCTGARGCTGDLWQEHMLPGLSGHTDVLKTRQSRRLHSAPCVGITGTTARPKTTDEPPVPRKTQELQRHHSSDVTPWLPVPRAGC